MGAKGREVALERIYTGTEGHADSIYGTGLYRPVVPAYTRRFQLGTGAYTLKVRESRSAQWDPRKFSVAGLEVRSA